MSVQSSTHQLQNYTVLQPTSILSAAVNNAAISEPPSLSPIQGVASSAPTITGDIHICGSCNTQFTDLKVFVDHKQQGCHHQGRVSDTLPPTQQTTVSSHLTATQPPLMSPSGTIVPVGMPVGMQHVIVQTPSGPPQFVRIVLEPSIATSMASTIPTVSAAAQLTQPLNPIEDHGGAEHLTLQLQPDILQENQREHINHEISEGNRMDGITTQDSVSSASNLLQLTSITESWATNREREGTVELGDSESGGLSSLHTEEDEVASFLASQLGSQNITVSGVSSSTVLNSDPAVHYTSAPSHGRRSGYTVHVPESQQTLHNLDKNEVVTTQRGKTTSITQVKNNQQMKKNQQDHTQKDKSKLKTCPNPGCNYSTSANKDLVRHIRIHTGEKPFACKECGNRFTRADKLKVHQRIHTKERPYWCKEPGCQYRGIDSGSLTKHMRIHRDERPYKCQICSYRSRDGSQLTVHLRSHTGDVPFQCMVEGCSSAFKTSSDLKRHERLHTGYKPFKCSHCEYACAIKSNLNMHVKLNHFQGAKFTCSKCNFIGSSRRQLKEHEKTHSAVLYKCDFCDHVSTSNPGIRQHMVIHRQEKPYQCNYCLYSSRTAKHLNQHLTTKHGCDLPHKKRGTSSDTTTNGIAAPHRSRVGGGRRVSKPSCYRSFKCKECDSGFVRFDSYKSHMRQHEKHKKMIANAQEEAKKPDANMYNIVVQGDMTDKVEANENSDQNTGLSHTASVNALSCKDPIEDSKSTLQISTSEGQNSFQVEIPNTTESQPNEGPIDPFNYVITIGGISTVFPNPGRLASSVVPEELDAPVEYITSDIPSINHPSKDNTQNSSNYNGS